jgi:hypothetical protein
MSRGGDTCFRKGQSGNPAGRPRKRRPHVSAFDIIFDKTLTVTQGGIERELTVDEALQLQTYQAALKGSRMAIRKVLKMIETREAAMARKAPSPAAPARVEMEYDSDNATEAMRILGIGDYLDEPDRPKDNRRFRLHLWATQAALSRPGRRKIDQKEVENIKRVTFDADKLRWPKGRVV